ncbi:M1 family metallopeptidase [uncultured Ilumatobacter sp.]|uniref:M1 family metallopeptidase n=1 Tax=uncultured Ilumatobacter sp. TaxID=879968 RepID=UPI00374ECE74
MAADSHTPSHLSSGAPSGSAESAWLDTLDPYRLPAGATPNRYDIRLRPALDDSTFIGTVSIQLDVAIETDTFVLNAAELTIGECSVNGTPATAELVEEADRLIVRTAAPIATGSATMDISFAGILNDKLRGFYRSTYNDANGAEQVIATTQMQSTDCRRAFPCWDEPEFKAVFGITLDIADGLNAISNGPEIERVTTEENDDGRRTVIRFADTMTMSTYLVAFIVGQLEMTAPTDVNGSPMRVVHIPGKSHLTDFGMDVGVFCLKWFEEYYGIPYPSDKVDLAGLPDFAAGAMENLGCITFRESLLLVDPATSTQNEQQLVVDVVAHELAHMWFGDLVTMRWWNGIWLNEAFATFMEIAACDAYRPDWERWTSFGLERSAAFDVDALDSTRSVEFEVRSPADCEGMFDVLTYQKGGSLLRMLEQYLGEQTFREGVSHYLGLHSYKNTETNDLWDAIESTSGEPVRRIMDSWIWQPGFPLITATISDDGTSIELSQQRFLLNPESATDPTEQMWVVPVHVSNGGTTTTVLLDSTHTTVALADPAAPVIVNAGGHGFYRVAYDATLRARLAGALGDMNTLERYSLVDDAWAATVGGSLSSVELLTFLEEFGDEREHAVWQAIVIALRGISRLIDDDALPAFQLRVRTLVQPALAELGEPQADESDLAAKLRGLLLSTAGVLGRDEFVIDLCRDLLESSTEPDNAVDPELVAAATSVVAATGTVADYERLQHGFLTASTPQEQLRQLYALTEFDDEALILRTCEFALTDNVKTQNAPFVLRMAMANRRHGAAAWGFIKDNWEHANKEFPTNTISRMVDSVKLLTTPELVADVQMFFVEHPIPQAVKTLDQILERQGINAALLARDAASLRAHLIS